MQMSQQMGSSVQQPSQTPAPAQQQAQQPTRPQQQGSTVKMTDWAAI